MNDERYYEILGLKPHATRDEIKTAYRDMAKVWHPDRFAHDPKLQQKAQEKLKEINDAYQQLNLPPHARRNSHAHDAGRHAADYRQPHARREEPRPRREEQAPAVVIIRETTAARRPYFSVFAAGVVAVVIFVGASRWLDSKGDAAQAISPAASSSEGQASGAQSSEEFSSAGAQKERKNAGRQKASDSDAAASAPDPFTSARAMPTVSRTIDPTTGLLATRACPNRTLLTFPAGGEPRQSCTADHTPKQTTRPAAAAAPESPARAQSSEPAASGEKGKSRLKSVVSTVANPSKWFKKKKEKTPDQP